MESQSPAATLGKHREIAARLRGLDHAERVPLTGDRQIFGIIAGDLQKNAAVGTAFVGLSGGMQEARSEAEYRGHFSLVTNGVADALQSFFGGGIHGDVPKNGKIVAGAEPRKMSLQNSGGVQAAVDRRHIFFISEKLDATG